MEVIYIPCYYTKEISAALMNELLKYVQNDEKIGIVYVIQHEKNANELKKFLEENKKRVFVCGKILGCDISNAKIYERKVEKFIYVGSGKFHPHNLKAQIGKDVLIFDPISHAITKISDDEIMAMKRKKHSRIAKASLANVFGIVVSLRTYQNKIQEAFKLKEKIEKKGKKAFVFVGNDINYSNLLGFKVDAFINTACPRISEDEFQKVMINTDEVEFVL